MGNDAKKQQQKQNDINRQKAVDLTSSLVHDKAFQPTPLDTTLANNAASAQGHYNDAIVQNKQDYADIMGQYKGEYAQAAARNPTTFNFERVNNIRPAELDEAYGNLRSAGKGYQTFADTGGYSEGDISDLRARGVAPIRTAYGNAMQEMSRARSLGGAGGSPNYIAAVSKSQRELPQQMADATQGVNAGLAEQIRSGKLQGLAGLSGVGSTMGGFASADAARSLQAATTNSQGTLQAAGMTEDAYNNALRNRMGILSSQNQLYGTTPGMASMFGNQALAASGQQISQNNANNQFGLGLIGANLGALNDASANQGTPWWKTALGVAGTVAPYVAMAASDKNIKHDIHVIDENKVRKGIKKLNLHTWKYDGDNVKHMGPMAQDVKKYLGIGDGKTIHLADIMGVMIATAKDGAHV